MTMCVTLPHCVSMYVPLCLCQLVTSQYDVLKAQRCADGHGHYLIDMQCDCS